MVVLSIPKSFVGKPMMGGIGSREDTHDVSNRIGRYLGLSVGIRCATRFQTGQERGISGIVQLRMATIKDDSKCIFCRYTVIAAINMSKGVIFDQQSQCNTGDEQKK